MRGRVFGVPLKWLVAIAFFVLLEPFHYFLLINYPLEGRAFTGYDSDEGLVLGMMRSVEQKYTNLWSSAEDIFHNPAITSPYAYIPFGFLASWLGMDALVMNILAKFVLSLIMLVLVYKVIENLVKDENQKNIAFALFLLPMGLEPFLYLLSLITRIEFLGAGLTYEWPFLSSHISRIYYYLSLITGLYSFLMYTRNRKIHAGVFLGLTLLVYPIFAFAFAVLLFLYQLNLWYMNDFYSAFRNTVKSLLPVYVIAVPFAVPWILSILTEPEIFALYRQNSVWWRAHLFSIVGSYFIALFVIAAANYEKLLNHRKILAAAVFLSALVFIHELQMLSVPLADIVALPDAVFSLAEIGLVILFLYGALLVLKSRLPAAEKFFALWVLLFVPMSIINPAWVFWIPHRIGYLLRIPIISLAAIYAADALDRIAKTDRKKIKVLFIIILVSASSFMIYNYRFQESPRRTAHDYFLAEDYEAMKYLDTLPEGLAISSPNIAHFLPGISGQFTLYHPAEAQYYGGGPDREEKKLGLLEFYSGNMTAEESEAFLRKYGIDYVFFGEQERNLGSLDPGSLPFLEKIYDNRARIYAVKQDF